MVIEPASAVAFVKDPEVVELDEWEDAVCQGVAEVSASEEGGAFLVIIEGDVESDGAGELEAIPEFEEVEGGDESAVSRALEDIAVSGRDLDLGRDAGGKGVDGIVVEGPFEAGGEVGESGFFGEGLVWIEVNVAVFHGHKRESIGKGVFELEGTEVEIPVCGNASDRGVERAWKLLVHVDGVQLGARHGEIEEGGIRDRADGAFKRVFRQGGQGAIGSGNRCRWVVFPCLKVNETGSGEGERGKKE